MSTETTGNCPKFKVVFPDGKSPLQAPQAQYIGVLAVLHSTPDTAQSRSGLATEVFPGISVSSSQINSLHGRSKQRVEEFGGKIVPVLDATTLDRSGRPTLKFYLTTPGNIHVQVDPLDEDYQLVRFLRRNIPTNSAEVFGKNDDPKNVVMPLLTGGQITGYPALLMRQLLYFGYDRHTITSHELHKRLKGDEPFDPGNFNNHMVRARKVWAPSVRIQGKKNGVLPGEYYSVVQPEAQDFYPLKLLDFLRARVEPALFPDLGYMTVRQAQEILLNQGLTKRGWSKGFLVRAVRKFIMYKCFDVVQTPQGNGNELNSYMSTDTFGALAAAMKTLSSSPPESDSFDMPEVVQKTRQDLKLLGHTGLAEQIHDPQSPKFGDLIHRVISELGINPRSLQEWHLDRFRQLHDAVLDAIKDKNTRAISVGRRYTFGVYPSEQGYRKSRIIASIPSREASVVLASGLIFAHNNWRENSDTPSPSPAIFQPYTEMQGKPVTLMDLNFFASTLEVTRKYMELFKNEGAVKDPNLANLIQRLIDGIKHTQ